MERGVETLAKLIAPVMPFTAEEVWSFLPGRAAESVHLAEFPAVDARLRDAALETRWEKLLRIREAVMVELEKARQTGAIGKSLEAQVLIEPDSDATGELLKQFAPVLEMVLIVSQAQIGKPTGGALRVKVSRAAGRKCVRCWRWSEDVGKSGTGAELCGRCADVVKELAKTKP